MRKNKKASENPNITASVRKSARLRSYRERLENERLEWERKRNALFRSRVNSASERKAPRTVRTKAYYRFSRSYPSVVSPDGFRENVREKEKLTVKSKILLAVACILVFVLSYTGIKTGVALSLYDPDVTEALPVVSEEKGMSAYFVSPAEFSSTPADELCEKLLQEGYNTAVIEFKSEYGYVYFDVGSFTGASADKKIPGAAEKVKAMNDAGISCIAYISCFTDSVAASSLSGMEVLTSAGGLFSDSNGNMWLDPYFYASHDYIINLAKKAIECGFGKVLLDNVCFPSDFLLAAPVYLSYEEGMTKNGALTQFISDVCAEVGKNNVIVCGDITAFAEISALPDEKYGGELTDAACSSFCLDFRSGSQYTAQLENSEKLRYVEQMPLAFILDAATLAINELGNKTDAYFFCVMIDAEEENAEKYVNFAGTENIISVIPD